MVRRVEAARLTARSEVSHRGMCKDRPARAGEREKNCVSEERQRVIPIYYTARLMTSPLGRAGRYFAWRVLRDLTLRNRRLLGGIIMSGEAQTTTLGLTLGQFGEEGQTRDSGES